MVTIPPEWLKQNALKAGDRVILVANRHLTILKDNPEFITKLQESLQSHLLNSARINNGSVSTQDTSKQVL